MAERVILGKLDSTNYGCRVSKPGTNVLTTSANNYIFDSTINRTGQIVAGGVGIQFDGGTNANSASETIGINFMTSSGVQKEQLEYVPLIVHVERNVGEFQYDDDLESEGVGDIGMVGTSSISFTPYQWKPENDTTDETPGKFLIVPTVPEPGRSYVNISTIGEDCLDCSYYVLRIPCAFGFMTSDYF